MKNFPNQAIELTRIRQTLEVIEALHQEGQRTDDDGVLGYALARARAYTFRRFDYTGADADFLLEARIRHEQRKPSSSQGARTNAREMRRTLRALGWIDSHGAMTQEGREFHDAPAGSQEERLTLAAALLDLEVIDQQGNVSHPVRVMLDLLDQAPSHHREGLELALEAVDDSDAERARVRRLYAMTSQRRLQELAVSEYQVANARKIFPSLAKAAGLVVEDAHGDWFLSPDGQGVSAAPPGVSSRTALERTVRSRGVTAREVDEDTVARQGATTATRRTLSPEEQQRAAELLAERTQRHQRIVRAVAAQISRPGRMYEDPLSYDLLWVPDDEDLPIVLFEIKTLDGDLREQCRRAVAQLSWYHFFDVSPSWPTRPVREVAVFDGDVDESYLAYLTQEDIAVLRVLDDSELTPLTDLSKDLPTLLQGEC